MIDTPAMTARALTKRFGGLVAVNQVSLDLWRKKIHAVIGPNGAGKSTLTNLLSGELAASAGDIGLNGVDVTKWPVHRISRQGLGRSYQRTNIFPTFTVWENVRLAAQSRDQRAWHWLSPSEKSTSTNARASRALQLAGLEKKSTRAAGFISYGEQRQLEIAMTLATEPTVLLLDEPLAGMGQAEAERIVELLLEIKKDHAILLVEHDMDAVFMLADILTVMVNGIVIKTGSPDDVRADQAVQAAYLGEEL